MFNWFWTIFSLGAPEMSIGTFIILYKLKRLQSDYIEDITLWREDMNFIFEWQNNIVRTSAASE